MAQPAGFQADLESIRDDIAAWQAQHLLDHGNYCQLPAIASADPTNGDAAVVDQLTVKAPNRDHTWTDTGGTIPAGIKGNVECFEYQGPSGEGWYLVGRTALAGGGIGLCQVHGAGTEDRTQAWSELDPDER